MSQLEPKMNDNNTTAQLNANNQTSDLTPDELKRATEPIIITEKTHPESMLFKITDLLHSGKDGKGLISVESLLTLYQLLTLAFSTATEDNDKANNLKKIITNKNAPTPDLNWEDMACDDSENETTDTQTNSTRPTHSKPLKRKNRSEEDEDPKFETYKTIPSRRTKKAAKKSTTKNATDSPTLRTTSPSTSTNKPASPTAHTSPQTPTHSKTKDGEDHAAKKNEKTPPIILHNKKEETLEKDLKLAGLTGYSANDQKDSLRINTDNSSIYRRIINFLDKRSISFHCFTLREDKTYRIVLKGVPENLSDVEVEELLRQQGFPILKAQRMRKGQDRTPMALLLLDVAHTEEGKKLFTIRRLGSYNVSAESLRRKTEPGQCHNCQKYGHSQTGCHAQPRCVKCGKEHRTDTCTKKREDGPATCANCSGHHPANYRGCPNHPKSGKPIKRAANWPTLPTNTGRFHTDQTDTRRHNTDRSTGGQTTQHRRTNTSWAAKVADTTQLRPTTHQKVSTIHHSPYISRDAERDRALEELVRELRDSVERSQALIARVCAFHQQTTSRINHGQH